MSSFKHTVFILILLSTCGQGDKITPSRIKSITAYQNCSQKWFNKEMKNSQTLCQSGSLVSSLAMILQTSGKTINNRPVNPDILNNYLLTQNGYKEGGDIQFSVLNDVGLNLVRTVSDLNTALEYYEKDYYVIFNLNFGKNYGVMIGYIQTNGKVTQYRINNPINPSESAVDPKDISVALIFKTI